MLRRLNDAADLDAVTVADRVRGGDLTVVDVAESVIDRVRDRDAEVRAFAYFDADFVREQARALDDRSVKGPLHGVPIGIKDVINTRDMPTEHHNRRYAGSRPGVDAACVDTLRAAGALLVGKTATTEFAATAVGGPARNPHDPRRTPGGSSSGSAAAVADGQVALALGTQTGGSTIRPASFCGTYGWKPTWNVISREGLKMYSATCDTVGLFARSAADLALLADVFDLDQPEAPTPTTVAGLRISVCRSPAWPRALPATRDALTHGAEALRRAGATVVDLDLGESFDRIAEVHRTILGREGRSALLNEYRNTADLSDDFTSMVENRTGLTPSDYRAAYRAADRCRDLLDEMLADTDAVLTPSVTGEAPLGLDSTGDASFNSLWTLMQVPVVTVPGHVGPAGMPVGLSLVGRSFDDRRLIAVAGLAGALWEAAGDSPRALASTSTTRTTSTP